MLLHHVMGELEGIKGAWGYVEGGMGAVSNAIARSARTAGASVFTEKVRTSTSLVGSQCSCMVIPFQTHWWKYITPEFVL